ncbi:MAG: alanine:cation symporter family protein [bacterium]|nr:alanine:cation symporter family protein [bacterium]MCP5065998.1 alanine:cation symporter family protein [bacterium]
MSGLDAWVNDAVAPVAEMLSRIIFFEVPLFGAQLPLVVLWLVVGAVWFTLFFRFVNLREFGRAIRIVSGRTPVTHVPGTGEVTHFQALATAISGTVGIGNIGGVAVAISLGGPGAAFWLVVAGLLGMSSKFVECTLGVMYRRENPDGTVSGGAMYYLSRGLAERGLPRLGRAMGAFYAAGIVIGCMGIGNMFQSNQAFVQLVTVTGGPEASWFADKGWLVGLVLAFLVGIVIVGGIRSIARVTEKIVPFMAALYLLGCAVMLSMNAEAIPFALREIVHQAFDPDALSGGALGVLIIGFKRAVFSNEAGLGSATIAHAAVRTNEPMTEGLVALLEPFIDTVVICSATALVIVTTLYYEPDLFASGLGGVEMTSAAFARNVSWSPAVVAVAALLFAFSTMLSWSYYGLKGWTYLVGEGRRRAQAFNAVFCAFVALGCMMKLQAILDFSDAMVFVLCVPNVLGLYLLAPVVKRELAGYRERHP